MTGIVTIASVLGLEPGFVIACLVFAVVVSVSTLISAGARRIGSTVIVAAVPWVLIVATVAGTVAERPDTWSTLATTGFVVTASVAIAIGSSLAALPGAVRRSSRSGRDVRRLSRGPVALLLVMGTACAGAVAALTLTPTPVAGGASRDVWAWVIVLHDRGVPTWLDATSLQWCANVVLFLPVGLVLVLAVGIRRWWAAALGAVVLSVAVEGSQAVFLPGRYADVADVLANAAGGVLGCVAGVLLVDVVRRRGLLGELRHGGPPQKGAVPHLSD